LSWIEPVEDQPRI
jgi:tetratricopeptide (TPR) repeat protein